MAKDMSAPEGPFDLDKVRSLIELMAEHDLREVCLRRGDERWRLKRGPQEVVQMLPASPQPAMTPAPPPAGSPAATAPASPPAEAAPAGKFIKSPTVGTFYASPTPEDPPFVKVGTKVTAETVVCIVEAMKVFNQIPAEVGGTVAEILVSNGDPVEFGQNLFRVTE